MDAKWKHADGSSDDLTHGISQGDVYQLHAYAGRYECGAVALVYPKSRAFALPLRYRLFDGRVLIAMPFDVARPERSVAATVDELERASVSLAGVSAATRL